VGAAKEMPTLSPHVQENGGRKSRRALTNDAGDMDVFKVVEWVSHGRLDHLVQHNEPTGQDKLRKVRPCHIFFQPFNQACTNKKTEKKK
jgi:hypothetical protein